MRAVVQRVSRGAVCVDGGTVGEIGPGFVVLLGIAATDGPAEVAAFADKLVGLRVFRDEADRMNRSLLDTGGAVLLISQFTLLGDVRRGRRPSFTAAAPPEVAEPVFEAAVKALVERGVEVETGRFGAMMEVELINDGPVTITMEISDGRVQ